MMFLCRKTGLCYEISRTCRPGRSCQLPCSGDQDGAEDDEGENIASSRSSCSLIGISCHAQNPGVDQTQHIEEADEPPELEEFDLPPKPKGDRGECNVELPRTPPCLSSDHASGFRAESQPEGVDLDLACTDAKSIADPGIIDGCKSSVDTIGVSTRESYDSLKAQCGDTADKDSANVTGTTSQPFGSSEGSALASEGSAIVVTGSRPGLNRGMSRRWRKSTSSASIGKTASMQRSNSTRSVGKTSSNRSVGTNSRSLG